jgi:hypothetical protein
MPYKTSYSIPIFNILYKHPSNILYFIQSHHIPLVIFHITGLLMAVAFGGWETIRLTCMFLLESEIWKRSKKAFTSLAGSHRVDSTAFYHGYSQAKQRI